MPSVTIAIDIGNTNTRVAHVDRSRLQVVRRLACPTAQACHELPKLLTQLLPSASSARSFDLSVASVVPAVSTELITTVRAIPGLASLVQIDGTMPSLPFAVHYAQPQRLGADRIADCLYATTRFPGQDVVIIDAGSAITVDLLSRHRGFLGGAIMPGVTSQLSCLHRDTALLQEPEQSAALIDYPGASTDACILSGVVLGCAAAVTALVHNAAAACDGPPTIIACGGAWPLLSPYIRLDLVHVPDCTLIGTALALR